MNPAIKSVLLVSILLINVLLVLITILEKVQIVTVKLGMLKLENQFVLNVLIIVKIVIPAFNVLSVKEKIETQAKIVFVKITFIMKED